MTNAPSLDTRQPNAARMWDYLLGGKDNFEADRVAADKINDICAGVGAPDGRVVALENRGFIRRAVTFLAAEAGIRQFVDIGAGLPTRGNVHDIARAAAPDEEDVRVVYVDNDPLVLSHGRALLADHTTTKVILGDLRDPQAILDDPELTGWINPDKPVAILLVAVLHLLGDADDPATIVAQLRDWMAPGSYLALTHSTSDARPELAAAVANEFVRQGVNSPLIPRRHTQILGFLDGFDLIAPGMVFPTRWRPDAHEPDDDGAQWMYAAVGRWRS